MTPYKYIRRGTTGKKKLYLGKRWCCHRSKGAKTGHAYIPVRLTSSPNVRNSPLIANRKSGSEMYPAKFLLSFLCISFNLFVECASDPGGPSHFCAVCPCVPTWAFTIDILLSAVRDSNLPGQPSGWAQLLCLLKGSQLAAAAIALLLLGDVLP